VKRQKREKNIQTESEKVILESDRKIETEIIESNRTDTQKMSRVQLTAV
jgi:hypothetical protein